MKKKVNYLVQAGIIASIYAALTYVSAFIGLAYGNIQFRFSEAVTILAIYTPAAIPGLTIGCFLGNLASPFGIIDVLCGTFATLLASILTRLVRNVRICNIPWLAPLPPVLTNSLIVGIEIAFFMPEGFTWIGFASAALSVGLGELIVCYVLGLPFALLLEKTGTIHRVFENNQ